jgi:hypothetical protein
MFNFLYKNFPYNPTILQSTYQDNYDTACHVHALKKTAQLPTLLTEGILILRSFLLTLLNILFFGIDTDNPLIDAEK